MKQDVKKSGFFLLQKWNLLSVFLLNISRMAIKVVKLLLKHFIFYKNQTFGPKIGPSDPPKSIRKIIQVPDEHLWIWGDILYGFDVVKPIPKWVWLLFFGMGI